MADGRECQEWLRVAPVIAALTGINLRRIIPERYQSEEPIRVPTATESDRAWKVLFAGFMGAPKSWD